MRAMPKMTRQSKKSGDYAIVRFTIDGKRKIFYLGAWNSPEAESKYRQLATLYYSGELESNSVSKSNLAIEYLYDKFLDTIEGKRDSDSNNYRRAMRYAIECFGDNLAIGDFSDDTRAIGILTRYQSYLLSIAGEERYAYSGFYKSGRRAGMPRKIKIKREWTYTGINRLVKYWLSLLRWGCRQGIIPFNVLRVADELFPLTAKSGLKRAPAAQTVEDSTLKAIMPFMTPTLREMIQIQRGTGMRAIEICELRVGDIDQSGERWKVKTQRHKTERFCRNRYFSFSLEETELLRRRIDGKSPEAFVFSQKESFQEYYEMIRAGRKTPVYKQERAHEKKVARVRLNRFHDYFTEKSYGQSVRTAIRRARKAGVECPDFAPKDIRHAAYTAYSAKYGVELASKNAGHTSPRMADVYDHSLALAADKLASERGLFGVDG